PGLGADVARRADDVVEPAHDHWCTSLTRSALLGRDATATLSSSTSRPRTSSASVIVSGGRSLTTSSLGPAVSIIRPRSKAAFDTAAASLGGRHSSPWISPRPRASRTAGLFDAI